MMPASVTNPAYSGLAYGIQAKIEGLFNSGLLQRNELDARCFMELRKLPEYTAVEVVDTFCESDLSDIRDKTAFFLGIVKRFQNERSGGGGGGGAFGGYGAPPAGSYSAPPPGGYGGYGGGHGEYGAVLEKAERDLAEDKKVM